MIMIHEGRKAIDLSGTWKYRYETEKTDGISTEDFYAGERKAEVLPEDCVFIRF